MYMKVWLESIISPLYVSKLWQQTGNLDLLNNRQIRIAVHNFIKLKFPPSRDYVTNMYITRQISSFKSKTTLIHHNILKVCTDIVFFLWHNSQSIISKYIIPEIVMQTPYDIISAHIGKCSKKWSAVVLLFNTNIFLLQF